MLSKELNLPMDGVFYINGSCYWSSSLYLTYAYYLYLTESNINSSNYKIKTIDYFIRCIKK